MDDLPPLALPPGELQVDQRSGSRGKRRRRPKRVTRARRTTNRAAAAVPAPSGESPRTAPSEESPLWSPEFPRDASPGASAPLRPLRPRPPRVDVACCALWEADRSKWRRLRERGVSTWDVRCCWLWLFADIFLAFGGIFYACFVGVGAPEGYGGAGPCVSLRARWCGPLSASLWMCAILAVVGAGEWVAAREVGWELREEPGVLIGVLGLVSWAGGVLSLYWERYGMYLRCFRVRGGRWRSRDVELWWTLHRGVWSPFWCCWTVPLEEGRAGYFAPGPTCCGCGGDGEGKVGSLKGGGDGGGGGPAGHVGDEAASTWAGDTAAGQTVAVDPDDLAELCCGVGETTTIAPGPGGELRIRGRRHGARAPLPGVCCWNGPLSVIGALQWALPETVALVLIGWGLSATTGTMAVVVLAASGPWQAVTLVCCTPARSAVRGPDEGVRFRRHRGTRGWFCGDSVRRVEAVFARDSTLVVLSAVIATLAVLGGIALSVVRTFTAPCQCHDHASLDVSATLALAAGVLISSTTSAFATYAAVASARFGSRPLSMCLARASEAGPRAVRRPAAPNLGPPAQKRPSPAPLPPLHPTETHIQIAATRLLLLPLLLPFVSAVLPISSPFLHRPTLPNPTTISVLLVSAIVAASLVRACFVRWTAHNHEATDDKPALPRPPRPRALCANLLPSDRQLDLASIVPVLRILLAAAALATLELHRGGLWNSPIPNQAAAAALGLAGPCPSASPMAYPRIVAAILAAFALFLLQAQPVAGPDALPAVPSIDKDPAHVFPTNVINPFLPAAAPPGASLVILETPLPPKMRHT